VLSSPDEGLVDTQFLELQVFSSIVPQASGRKKLEKVTQGVLVDVHQLYDPSGTSSISHMTPEFKQMARSDKTLRRQHRPPDRDFPSALVVSRESMCATVVASFQLHMRLWV
jgi:hypothetical protein